MSTFRIIFLILFTSLATYAQGVDSVVSTRVIRNNKNFKKDLVYYKGYVTQELYADSSGAKVTSIYYFNSGQKQKESFTINGSYSISRTYYKNGKQKEIDSTTANGYWYKSYYRFGRQNYFRSSGNEHIYLDSQISQTKDYDMIFREYDSGWKLAREELYKNGEVIKQKGD